MSGVPCQVQPSEHGTARPLPNSSDLCAASHSGVTTKEYVDSGGIHVHAGAEAVQFPSTYCPSICIAPALEYRDHGLTDSSAFADIEPPGYDGGKYDITLADIAACQRASLESHSTVGLVSHHSS
jgi:hypothetical protein